MCKSNFKRFQISAITTLNRVCSGGISIMFLSKIQLFIFIFDHIWMFACWKVNTAATCTEAIFAQRDRLDLHITRNWSTNLKEESRNKQKTLRDDFYFWENNFYNYRATATTTESAPATWSVGLTTAYQSKSGLVFGTLMNFRVGWSSLYVWRKRKKWLKIAADTRKAAGSGIPLMTAADHDAPWRGLVGRARCST